MPLTLVINGQNRVFAGLTSPVMLSQIIDEMELKGDRIAVEHNGEIAQRVRWAEVPVATGDRLEVVHFVGGGTKCADGVGVKGEGRGLMRR
jgi:thiamine biosynthesis protein ThiS